VGLLALAEDKRPEANQIIELKPYALQRHNGMSKSTLAEYQLVAD